MNEVSVGENRGQQGHEVPIYTIAAGTSPLIVDIELGELGRAVIVNIPSRPPEQEGKGLLG